MSTLELIEQIPSSENFFAAPAITTEISPALANQLNNGIQVIAGYCETLRAKCRYPELLAIQNAAEDLSVLVSRAATPTRIEFASAKQPRKILLIDDDAAVRRFVRELLNTNGYAVRSADGYESAVALSQSAPGDFDLLVADLDMKPIDGEMTVRCIIPDQPNSKVLFISGRLDGPDRIGGYQLLRKPFANRTLIEIINGLLMS